MAEFNIRRKGNFNIQDTRKGRGYLDEILALLGQSRPMDRLSFQAQDTPALPSGPIPVQPAPIMREQGVVAGRPDEDEDIMEKFRKSRIERRQGYSDPVNALRRQEEIYREQAYPEPGVIHSQFQNIAEFDPAAAERLTSNEYGIRALPHQAAASALSIAENAKEKMEKETEKLMEELAKAKSDKLETENKERIKGVKARAQQDIWREEIATGKKEDWDEKRIKLELRKKNWRRFYEKPKDDIGTTRKGRRNPYEWILDQIKGVSDWV